MSDYEKFTSEEIIKALEFDIDHFKRKYDYHIGIAQVYLERIEEVHKKIKTIRQELIEKEERKYVKE